MQYRWIDRVADAERQRAKANLTAELSDAENDFDVEITRTFEVFAAPAAELPEYGERYKEWLRLAPYPNLVRGVYVVDDRNPEAAPKPIVEGEPLIGPVRWRDDSPRAAPIPPGPITTTAGPIGPQGGVQVFSQGMVVSSVTALGSQLTVDGNPVLVFPMAPMFSTFQVARVQRFAAPPRRIRLDRRHDLPPIHEWVPQWGLLVFDASYIRAFLLPRLVNRHFPRVASDYDILITDESPETRSRIVFQSESAPPEDKFAHPDASTTLLRLRPDCLEPPMSAHEVRVTANPPRENISAFANSVSELMTRRPTVCSAAQPLGDDSVGLWKISVRYRAGSLDQAMATFRQRNLLFGGGVLLVLALGILALIAFTERARALAQMKTEFVLGVSHELRTPLAVIRLAADNLKRGMVENSADARKYGEIVDAHASELSHMIEETFTFARMQSTALAQRGAPISPEQIVRSSLANCESVLKNAGIEMELDLEPNLPLIDVDARLMVRCLDNLIHNAAKHAKSGQWVAVRAARVDKSQREWVQISVEDKGGGISARDLPHIFEAFYRGKQEEGTQVHGVGLGLALVKRIIESHHGMIDVQSSKMTGTRFSLFLRTHLDSREGEKKSV
jgi:signal transduction histidine kinase